MTLKEIFEKVMVALDEAENESLSTNMEDYKNKIYDCADSCQRELAVFIDNIIKMTTLVAQGGVAHLPSDCFEIKGIYDSNNCYVSYDQVNNEQVWIADGSYQLKYAAYPQKIDNNTRLSYELEISKEAQEALIYGICAGLCINDEPELYSTYMDRYNGLCQSITERKIRYPKAKVVGGIRL